jgi:hypothetical protein
VSSAVFIKLSKCYNKIGLLKSNAFGGNNELEITVASLVIVVQFGNHTHNLFVLSNQYSLTTVISHSNLPE